MKILFIQTGGTIDKDYPQTTRGWAFEIDEPAASRLLEVLNPSFDYAVKTACRKDSLELTDADREKIVSLINQEAAEAYIITHGTDTIIETAGFLASQVPDKVVVLTGAMLPQRFMNSDAAINLGIAIGAAGTLTAGIYVAMHGVVKPFDLIQRDMQTGKFF
jgi:L-asparaginase